MSKYVFNPYNEVDGLTLLQVTPDVVAADFKSSSPTYGFTLTAVKPPNSCA